jgi:hypothetical protein
MQRSKVATLPRARRDELKRGYRDGHFTIDEALEWIRRKKPDADISRSGVYRYLARYRRTFERIQEAEQIAGRCMRELNEKPRGDVARLLTQMLSTLAMGTLHQQMDGATLDSKELFFLSTAIKNLASAEKTAVDRELMLRKQIAADLAKTVAPTLEKLDAGGLSTDTAAAIRAAIAEVQV